LIGFFNVIFLKKGSHLNIGIQTFHTAKFKSTEKVNINQKYFKKIKILFAFLFFSCETRELDFVEPFFTVTKNQNSHHKSFVHYPRANIL